ncbi:MAG: 23S rRNA (uracil(1939)-C(5))-methyltransferase RlmD [Ruminococcus sp.]|nr:23S rRNA (uracil(1939)-C(5))-methyltransferase RlmD [Ruminococcus sp.]
MLKKNDIVTIDITGLTSEGNGVGRADGFAVFVPSSAVGDRLEVKIVKVNKSFAYGITENIITPSPDRCESDCPVSRKCGGCSLRHITYEAELRMKEQLVTDAFKRIGGLDVPFDEILGCNSVDGYRNKAQYPVADADGKSVFGFYAPRSHRVIPFGECRLQPSVFNEISAEVTALCDRYGIPPYNEETGGGLLRHIFIRKGFHSGEIMLCLVVKKNCADRLSPLCDEVTKKFPDIKTIVMNINPDNTNVILGKKTAVLVGNGTIHDTMCKRQVTLSPQSFYQVNTEQAERLYAIAAEYADFSGNETLLDLYCGAGTIGLSMAHRVKKLIGVEIVPQAIENAKKNAADNSIDNAEFFCGDAGTIADKFAKDGLSPDVIILDPARKGCDDMTINAVLSMAPKKVVMISCNPSTAARDCKKLCDGGYTAISGRAVDLFPRTNHVECVVLMERAF